MNAKKVIIVTVMRSQKMLLIDIVISTDIWKESSDVTDGFNSMKRHTKIC